MKFAIDPGAYARSSLVRYFFALRPDERQADAIYRHAAGHCGGARLLSRDRLHVTMAITDDQFGAQRDMEDRLLAAGASISAQPFLLDLAQLHGTTRSVALTPRGRQPMLRALHGAMAQAMRRAQVPMRRDWSFSPHMTLYYRDGGQFQANAPTFRLDVQDFVLIRSHIGRTHHELLGRWVLKGREEQPCLF